MQHRLIAAFLLGVCMACCGCDAAREPDDQAYIIAVGVDKSDQKGMIDVTYVAALPVAASEGEAAAVAANSKRLPQK